MSKSLRITSNGRALETADGAPFFYLGDTAWALLNALKPDEWERYLVNRADKGFTVIQAVALGLMQGPAHGDTPLAEGNPPLIERDPLRPNEAYFRHVDAVMRRAAELGLVMGLLPTWGSNWKRLGAPQPPIFTVENARPYGRFLGERYRELPLIWILGGDANAETDEERAVIEEMAAGLDEGDGGAHLMTYHPRGPGMSSDIFHQASWLDFNMIQSSHGAHDHDNGLFVAHDYGLKPVKPTVDGEPRYETLYAGFYFKDYNRYDRFDDFDVRQAAYWAILAGAAGFTYGNNNVFQMWAPGRPSGLGANIPWWEALDHPGAFQMRYVRRLFEQYPPAKFIPDEAVIMDAPRQGGAKVRAVRASDGAFVLAYSPYGQRFTLNKSAIAARRVQEKWYDPRYGVTYHIHTSDNTAYQTYTPPTSGRGQDWVLILEGVAGDGFGSPKQE
jgi:hypothetical protein